jgi:hypothetical protein
MTQSPDLGKMIPGFEFLQDLARNSGAALPGLSHWVAPTLDPDEIGRRIEELRTVQFWLEQNGRMLGTTIQALEVQRMTLSTLKTMNVQVADLAEAFTIRMPEAPGPAPAPSPAAAAPSAAPPAAGPTPGARGRKAAAAKGANPGPASGAAPGVADPVQWWNALTQQFTQIATKAMQDGSVESAAQMARTLVRNSADAMGQALEGTRVKPDAAAARPPAAPAAAPAAAPTRKTRAKAAARGGR